MSIPHDLKQIEKQLKTLNDLIPGSYYTYHEATKQTKQTLNSFNQTNLKPILSAVNYGINISEILYTYQNILHDFSNNASYNNNLRSTIKTMSDIYDKFIDAAQNHDLNNFNFDTDNFIESTEELYDSIQDNDSKNKDTETLKEFLKNARNYVLENKKDILDYVVLVIKVFLACVTLFNSFIPEESSSKCQHAMIQSLIKINCDIDINFLSSEDIKIPNKISLDIDNKIDINNK